jgi:hypothetical protein
LFEKYLRRAKTTNAMITDMQNGRFMITIKIVDNVYTLNLERGYHLALGKYLGYPECCTVWFFEERIAKFPDIPKLTKQQEAIHGSNGFIPCPVCAEKVTVKTIGTLIKNRQCPTPYPTFRAKDRIDFQKNFNKYNHGT